MLERKTVQKQRPKKEARNPLFPKDIPKLLYISFTFLLPINLV